MDETAESRAWLYTALFSFVVFTLLSKLMFLLFPPPVHFRNQWKKLWLWGNISTSLIHSTITAVLSVYSLCRKPEMLEDMIGSWNLLAYYTLAFSTGYFIYDFVSLAFNDAEKSLCILIHHVIVTFAFMISLIHKKYIPFGLVALLMEVNSVFLHSRRLMRMSGISPSAKLYQVNAILLVGTFIIFRLVTCGWMLNFLVSHRNVLPTLHFAVGTGGMCVLTPQNIFLLKQVWTSDTKREESQKERAKDAQKELNGVPNNIAELKQFLQMTITHASE